MFSLLSLLSLANVLTATIPTKAALPRLEQAESAPYIAQSAGDIITIPQSVRPLPGGLDNVPVFNSNSPEIIQSDGILLSTFPAGGKSDPSAHLNYAFNGRFDVFSHHVARGQDDTDTRTVYEAILVHNPGSRPVTLSIREGVIDMCVHKGCWN